MKLVINEGRIDRAIRLALGLIVLALSILGQNWWLLLLAFPLLITGVTGFCGLYKLLGISTCPVDKRK